jgi:hypothetical protein
LVKLYVGGFCSTIQDFFVVTYLPYGTGTYGGGGGGGGGGPGTGPSPCHKMVADLAVVSSETFKPANSR